MTSTISCFTSAVNEDVWQSGKDQFSGFVDPARSLPLAKIAQRAGCLKNAAPYAQRNRADSRSIASLTAWLTILLSLMRLLSLGSRRTSYVRRCQIVGLRLPWKQAKTIISS